MRAREPHQVPQRQLLECTFLIPIRRDRNLSDGKRHNQAAWDWLENSLSEFGGATRDAALQEGWYLDPDTGGRVTDLSRRYTVAVSRKGMGPLRAVLREACSVFRQKCIYLSVAGQVEFVEGPSHETD
jgi:hypothetical protein